MSVFSHWVVKARMQLKNYLHDLNLYNGNTLGSHAKPVKAHLAQQVSQIFAIYGSHIQCPSVGMVLSCLNMYGCYVIHKAG